MSFDYALPGHWHWSTLNDAKAEGRSIVSGPFGSNIGKRFFVGSGVPVIRGNNLSLGMGRFKDDGFVYLTDEKAAEFKNCEAHPGDLLFTAAGTIGQVGIIPPNGKYPKYIISNKQLRARLDSQKVDPLFAYYWFASPDMVTAIQNRNTGSTIPLINLSVIKSLRIPVPPLHEQQQIVAHLSLLDDRIALLRETNATLEAIAQALFKSWFVDFDPVRAKMEGRTPEGMDEATAALFPDGLEASKLGLVPRGWRASTLADLTAEYGGSLQTGPFGSQLHAADYVEDGIPVIMPKDIKNRRATTDSVARIRAVDVERLARHKLLKGDIVFSRRGDVERHALISEREAGWICGTGCLLLHPGNTWLSSTFLSMTLDAPQARTWLVQHAVGATMPNINTAILGSVPVLLPPDALLIAFEEVISVTEAQRSQNSSMAETLATLRDTLLPRLISGALRLPVLV